MFKAGLVYRFPTTRVSTILIFRGPGHQASWRSSTKCAISHQWMAINSVNTILMLPREEEHSDDLMPLKRQRSSSRD